jgi:hypothetical protein
MLTRHNYDVDSLEALQATLAWSRTKRRGRQWVLMIPVFTVAIGLGCFEALHQTTPKSQHPVIVGPWMLKADRS